MKKVILFTLLMLSACASAGAAPNTARQSTGTGASVAPVPTQILAAKKVFISNVPGEVFYFRRDAEDDPYRPYNQFYAELKNWGYHELVSAPTDADLILEVRLSGRPVLSSATRQAPVNAAYLEVTVRDPKTQAVLWWLAERLEGANRVATGEKNYNTAMTNLVNDWKKLLGQPIDQTSNIKK